MRNTADKERLIEFLKCLAKEFPYPAKIYLVGGSTMIYEGFRMQSVDIDLTFEVDSNLDGKLVERIRVLKDRLNLNVEIVSPGDFIPLPLGWRDRSTHLLHLGNIGVYHFDLYSTALSKIERGHEQDLQDVATLVQSEKITHAKLRAYYEEIHPRMLKESLKKTSERLERNFILLETLLP